MNFLVPCHATEDIREPENSYLFVLKNHKLICDSAKKISILYHIHLLKNLLFINLKFQSLIGEGTKTIHN